MRNLSDRLIELQSNRLTYKSSFGDYGFVKEVNVNSPETKDHIGKLEDMVDLIIRFMEDSQ